MTHIRRYEPPLYLCRIHNTGFAATTANKYFDWFLSFSLAVSVGRIAHTRWNARCQNKWKGLEKSKTKQTAFAFRTVRVYWFKTKLPQLQIRNSSETINDSKEKKESDVWKENGYSDALSHISPISLIWRTDSLRSYRSPRTHTHTHKIGRTCRGNRRRRRLKARKRRQNTKNAKQP